VTRGKFDLWLDRGMKMIGIAGFLGASFMAVNGMIYLPKRVEAQEFVNASQEDRLTAMKSTYDQKQVATELRLQSIEKDVGFIAATVKDIKEAVKRT